MICFAMIGQCPVCSQGRQLIAREKRTGRIYILCEECESEWLTPEDARVLAKATRGVFGQSEYLSLEEVAHHPWARFIQ